MPDVHLNKANQSSSVHKIIRLQEDELTSKHSQQIRRLLDTCFPNTFMGRVYFKQLPHFRLLYVEDDCIVGQVGIDYRVVRLGTRLLNVFGVIDLCVEPSKRRQGIAGELLNHLETIATGCDVDAIFLFADNPALYQRHGFKIRRQHVKWLAIDDGETLGVSEELFENVFLYKSEKDVDWETTATLDMLGYLY